MFSRWGAFIYRHRRVVFVLAILVAAGASALAADASKHLTTGGWLDPDSESSQVSHRLEQDFGGGRTAYVAVFRSGDPAADAT